MTVSVVFVAVCCFLLLTYAQLVRFDVCFNIGFMGAAVAAAAASASSSATRKFDLSFKRKTAFGKVMQRVCVSAYLCVS